MIKQLLYLGFLFIIGCGSNDNNSQNTNDLDLGVIKSGVQQAYLKGTTNTQYGFYLYTPSQYDATNEEKFPLLIYLHGGGSRGDSSINPNDLNVILLDGPPSLINEIRWNPKYPMIVACPQSPTVWNTEHLHDFISFLVESLKVDTQRIYMTGFSMGGKGCFDYVSNKGDNSYVAALVPIAGFGDASKGKQFKNIPVWAFHGDADNIVPYSSSVSMINAINAEDPATRAKLTIYSGVNHNSWTRTYDNTAIGEGNVNYDPFDITIYEWMYLYKK